MSRVVGEAESDSASDALAGAGDQYYLARDAHADLLVSSEPVGCEPVSDLYVTATTMRKGCTVLQFRKIGQQLQPSATLPVPRATVP